MRGDFIVPRTILDRAKLLRARLFGQCEATRRFNLQFKQNSRPRVLFVCWEPRYVSDIYPVAAGVVQGRGSSLDASYCFVAVRTRGRIVFRRWREEFKGGSLIAVRG